jgi:hypothetical protein
VAGQLEDGAAAGLQALSDAKTEGAGILLERPEGIFQKGIKMKYSRKSRLRLFERIALAGFVKTDPADEFVRNSLHIVNDALKKGPIIAISYAEQIFRDQDKKHFYRQPEIMSVYEKCMAPPFQHYWMEMFGTLDPDPESDLGHTGYGFVAIDMYKLCPDPDKRLGVLRGLASAAGANPSDSIIMETRWMVSCSVMVIQLGGAIYPPFEVINYHVDAEGAITAFDTMYHPALTLAQREKLRKETTRGIWIPVMEAHKLLHAKNVSMTEHEVAQPRIAKRMEKRLERDPGDTKYYTLSVTTGSKDKRREIDLEPSGQEVSLHTVRGHFATYTPEKPLFGRLVGQFFRPEHFRGSKAVGEIVKDYRLE